LTPAEISNHGYLTEPFYIEASCPPPESTTIPIVPYSSIPTSFSPVQITSTYTTTDSGVTALHRDMTTKFRIPIVSESTTTTIDSTGKPVVSTVVVDTVSEPIVDHYTTTTVNSVGVPTEHSHTTTLYEIPTKKEHTATTIIDGVKTTSEYTTTSYIYP